MKCRPLILDANNVIVRCVMASALEDLKAGGMFTGGIYGALRSIRSLLSMPDVPVDRVIAFFDHGVPERRRRLLPGYKSARQERRETLSEEERERAFLQVVQCYELFQSLGVLCLAYRDREADDCVAAAVRVLKDEEPVVVSSDADLFQTVAMGAEVWDQTHGRLVTQENFREITGVEPALYVVYRALVGDSSDSIDGARGCGPVRAAELLSAIVEADTDELPPTFRSLTPLEQLDELGRYLLARDALVGLKAWQQSVWEALPRLRRVACGIDLSASFGPVDALAVRLQTFPEVQPTTFLRGCKRFGMRSVLGDPEGYLRPFRDVQARRVGKKAGS